MNEKPARGTMMGVQMFGGNAGPVFPRWGFFTDMTAIALVNTKDGIVVAADGLSRWGDDSTRDDLVRQHERLNEKKVFKAECGAWDIAWALTGLVLNKDRSFSLITEVKRSFRVANEGSRDSLSHWLEVFSNSLRDCVSRARSTKVLGPFAENEIHPPGSDERFTFARILMAGYFYAGKPAISIVRISHKNGVLADPQKLICSPPEHDIFTGSDEIRKRYFDEHEDRRFKKYFRPTGPTLPEGLAHAKGYIEACSDPLASEVDPLCKGIGGHIHAAAVTRSGFVWLIPPLNL